MNNYVVFFKIWFFECFSPEIENKKLNTECGLSLKNRQCLGIMLLRTTAGGAKLVSRYST